MKRPPAIEARATEIVTVLSVSPREEVHSSLQDIFNHSKWKLSKTHSLVSALDLLRAQKTPVVLCETELPPGTWRDLLKRITDAPNARPSS